MLKTAICLGILALASGNALHAKLAQAESVSDKFAAFSGHFKRKYTSSAHEERARQAFAGNHVKIEAHNAKGLSWTMGHNMFSDLTPEEFKDRHLSGYIKDSSTNIPDAVVPSARRKLTTPTTTDWVAQGVVRDPIWEGNCGACYAISSVSAIESRLAITTGSFVKLSVQHLVTCSKNHVGRPCNSACPNTNGCCGGSVGYAIQLVAQIGLPKDSDSEYTLGGTCSEGADDCSGGATGGEYDKDFTKNYAKGKMLGECKASTSVTSNVATGKCVASAGTCTPTDSSLKTWTSESPVIVSIDGISLQSYYSGVLTQGGGGTPNHSVLIVGYGAKSTPNAGILDTFTIQNSWGPNWGESGRFMVETGINALNMNEEAYVVTSATKGGPISAPGAGTVCPAPTPPPQWDVETPQHPAPAPAPAVSATSAGLIGGAAVLAAAAAVVVARRRNTANAPGGASSSQGTGAVAEADASNAL
jgi:C1A family cysteine protease